MYRKITARYYAAKYNEWLELRVYQRCTSIFCTTEEARAALSKEYPAIDADLFRDIKVGNLLTGREVAV